MSAAIEAGRIGHVGVESRLGEDRRRRNPWDGPVALCGDGGLTREVSGAIICFAARPGGRYRLRLAGTDTPALAPTAQPTKAPGPVRFAVSLPGGQVVTEALGRQSR